MTDFELRPGLKVLVFERSDGPYFALREFDNKVLRAGSTKKHTLRVHGASEQAIRARITQVIMRLNMNAVKGNKHEIRILKERGILGKRAPKCSLLGIADTAKLLRAFGCTNEADDVDRMLAKFKKYKAQKAQKLAKLKGKPAEKSPKQEVKDEKVLSTPSPIINTSTSTSPAMKRISSGGDTPSKRPKISIVPPSSRFQVEAAMENDYYYDSLTKNDTMGSSMQLTYMWPDPIATFRADDVSTEANIVSQANHDSRFMYLPLELPPAHTFPSVPERSMSPSDLKNLSVSPSAIFTFSPTSPYLNNSFASFSNLIYDENSSDFILKNRPFLTIEPFHPRPDVASSVGYDRAVWKSEPQSDVDVSPLPLWEDEKVDRDEPSSMEVSPYQGAISPDSLTPTVTSVSSSPLLLDRFCDSLPPHLR